MRRVLLVMSCLAGSAVLLLLNWHQLGSPLPPAPTSAPLSTIEVLLPSPSPGLEIIHIEVKDPWSDRYRWDPVRDAPADIIECNDPEHKHSRPSP